MKAIDLFAGIGGASIGAVRVPDAKWFGAANHWPAAVHWHAQNHPNTVHACQDLQQTDWTTVPPHDLLMASPACQGHSKARGKEQPHHDALYEVNDEPAPESCPECHGPSPDGGDGYDGYCATCADKLEAKGHWK